MSEGGVGTSPHVFVVDSQANYIPMPNQKKPWQARAGQKLLFLLVGLGALALIIQGYLIYHLYQKTEAMSLSQSPSSSPALQGGSMSQVGSKEYTVPVTQTQTQHRPFAHLVGSREPHGQNNVVQWMNEGEAYTQNMTYEKEEGRLIVQIEGYYYLYSKVQHTAADCSPVYHRVMKDTDAYDDSIELLKSKTLRCLTSKNSGTKSPAMEDQLSNFLAGIFHLQKGDKIYVTLDNIQNIRPGTTENFMGAFMIFP